VIQPVAALFVRGGRRCSHDNAEFGQRMKGTGHWADLLRQRFALACRRHGFNREPLRLDCSLYHPSLLLPQRSLF
jgi:hypothetical protein